MTLLTNVLYQLSSRVILRNNCSLKIIELILDFPDPFAYIFDDLWHSVGESREVIIGHELIYRLLLVCFTERNNRIRIISDRIATKKERQDYEQHRKFQ